MREAYIAFDAKLPRSKWIELGEQINPFVFKDSKIIFESNKVYLHESGGLITLYWTFSGQIALSFSGKLEMVENFFREVYSQLEKPKLIGDDGKRALVDLAGKVLALHNLDSAEKLLRHVYRQENGCICHIACAADLKPIFGGYYKTKAAEHLFAYRLSTIQAAFNYAEKILGKEEAQNLGKKALPEALKAFEQWPEICQKRIDNPETVKNTLKEGAKNV